MSATSPALRWTAIILTVLLAAFLVFDGVTKVMKVARVMAASRSLGVPESATPVIGWILLACTALYLVPRTSVLGAILLTGFLGGTIVSHIMARSGTFPVVFSLVIGLLVWTTVAIRQPALVRTILGWPAASR